MKNSLRNKLLYASSLSFGLAIGNFALAIMEHNFSSIYYGWLAVSMLIVVFLIEYVIRQNDKIEGE